MAYQEFTWFPDVGSQQKVKPIVNTTKFGEGYQARVGFGLNGEPMVWSVSFDRDFAEATAILAFLRTRGGIQPFTWINPLNETGTYICAEWSTLQNRGTMKVTCDFTQVFEL